MPAVFCTLGGRRQHSLLWILRPGLHVKAIKRAYSRERLRALGMRVTSQGDAFSIETTSPPKKKWSVRDRSGTIDYIVTMPSTRR